MKSKILIALFFVLLPLASKATFKEAAKLYEKEQYQAAFNEFYELAQIGHKSSQFNVGIMYLEGKGVKQDLAKAYAWVKLSDEKANKEQKTLEEIQGYFSTPEMTTKAQEEFELIASKYSEEAIVKAYSPVITDDVEEMNSPEPEKHPNPEYPIKAQIKGITGWATFNLHLSPNGYPTDIRVVDSFPGDVFVDNSVSALKKWKFKGGKKSLDRVYIYRLAFALEGKRGKATASEYKNLKTVKEQAINGDPTSQFLHAEYGWYNHDGEGEFNSTAWYYEAARNGVANAQYQLAEKLLNGDGCKEDPAKAINWLTMSASGDFAASQFKLATLAFEKGDTKKGIYWLNRAFENNQPESSLDYFKLAYEMIHYVFQNDIEGIAPERIIEQLDMVEQDSVINPVNYYLYYAKAYRELGDFEEALDYQEEAIEELEDLGEEKIPQEMLDNLAYLEAKVG